MSTFEYQPQPNPERERLQRWRLILGGEAADALGVGLTQDLETIDAALARLYSLEESGPAGNKASRRGGSGRSIPSVARWLGDIRSYFPTALVQMMQHDAMERLHLRELLLEPEMLETAVPDVNLVANLMALGGVIPQRTRETARVVVRKVVDELMKKLEAPMRSAITGALDRSARNRRPRLAEINWDRTIRANLRHYQCDYHTIIPETLIGFGRKARRTQREIILCIDQSGSMANSIVYSSIFGAVMASLPAVATRLILFDTSVVDMTDQLSDPLEVLFGVQLGGGTDINRAVSYGQSLIRSPRDTIFVLISDLFEGGVREHLLRRMAELLAGGSQVVVLLALSDEGAPAYDRDLASELADLGVPSFACTPDVFPDLMAAAIRREDINLFAATRGILTSRGN